MVSKKDSVIENMCRSELKACEEKINLLYELMESSTQPFAAGYTDGRLAFCNNSFCLLTGYSKEELLKNITWSIDLTPPEWRDSEASMLDVLRRTGEPKSYEKEYLLKNGTRIPVELITHQVVDSSGNVILYYGFITDISERKRVEGALRKSESNMARAQQIARISNWELDIARRELTGSRVLYEICDIDPSTKSIDDFLKIVQPEERKHLIDCVNAAIYDYKPLDVESHITTSDGERFLHVVGEVDYARDGTPLVMFGIVKDITGRKQAEEKLRESEDRYRAFFENSIDAVLIATPEGRIESANTEACRILGMTEEEIVRGGKDGFADASDPRWEQFMEERERTGKAKGELNYKRKDGSIFPGEASSAIFKDRKGHIKTAVIIRDITERKQAENALRNNEKFLNNIFNCIQDGVSVLSKDLSIIRYNPTIEKWHGRDLTGKKCYRLFHGREEPCETCPSLRAMQEKTMQREVVRDLIGWKEIYAYPLVTDDGEVTGTIEQVRDITERKRAEEALSKNLAVLARSQEVARLGSWSIDFDSGKFELSDEIYRMYELEPGTEEPTPELSSRLTHPDDLERFKEFVESMRREGRMGSIDYRIMRPDGSVRYMHVTTDNVGWSQDGRVKMASGITQDITERKHTEEALKEAKAQAELYLDLMGHDINNMHQIALGYLEMAKDMHIEAGESEFLDKPIEVLQRSAQLIKNVRKLQKLQDCMFQTELVDVYEVLSDVQREFGAVPNKAITLNMNECEHCIVHANELLHDVFANLVSNAIKHTGDRADIAIVLNVIKDNRSRYCQVSVEDNGPGIPDELKGKIFNRVKKGDTKARGIGLGLYLVKSLVESYGGRVWVEDRVPDDHTKGARFVVILPAIIQ